MTNAGKKFSRKLNERFAQKQNELNRQPGIMGNGLGGLHVPNLDGFVYVLIGNKALPVFNNRVSPQIGAKVWVGYAPEEPNLFQVLSTRSETPAGVQSGFTGYAPARRYEWNATGGGQDPLNVHLRAFTPLKLSVSATGGMNVDLYRGFVFTGTDYVAISQQDIDLTAHIPATSNKAALVLITINNAGSIVQTKGSEVDIDALVLADLPSIPANTIFVCGAVRVYNGQTAIQEGRTNTDFVDLRFPGLGSEYFDTLYIKGAGVVGQVAEFVTDTMTLQAAKIIGPASNILTLTNAAASTLALNITAAKTLTLTAVDNYALTIPATGTAGLLGVANDWTAQNRFGDAQQTVVSDKGVWTHISTGIATLFSIKRNENGITQFSVANSIYTFSFVQNGTGTNAGSADFNLNSGQTLAIKNSSAVYFSQFVGANYRFGIGYNMGASTTPPLAIIHARMNTTTTNVIQEAMRIDVVNTTASTGGAAGFGAAYTIFAETATNDTFQQQAQISGSWIDATNATRKAKLSLSAYDTAARLGMEIEASGSAAKLGFFGAATGVQPANTTDLRTAIVNLGLLASGGATPLDLNGGAISNATKKDSGIHQSLSITYIDGTGTAGADNTAQTVKTVTLPANTMTQVGDRIRIRTYWRGDTGTAITGTNKLGPAGSEVSISDTTDLGGSTLQVNEAWLHYIDNTHANIIENEAGGVGALSAPNVAGFTWNASQDIIFTQSAAVNNHCVLFALIVDRFPKGV